mmetsp:Transcript_38291/g.121948  ORF Transcript_38291/g.121948 Transcript_38291/m.121948 type:complete len:275 (-) Transcript_38291:326-1150(-)
MAFVLALALAVAAGASSSSSSSAAAPAAATKTPAKAWSWDPAGVHAEAVKSKQDAHAEQLHFHWRADAPEFIPEVLEEEQGIATPDLMLEENEYAMREYMHEFHPGAFEGHVLMACSVPVDEDGNLLPVSIGEGMLLVPANPDGSCPLVMSMEGMGDGGLSTLQPQAFRGAVEAAPGSWSVTENVPSLGATEEAPGRWRAPKATDEAHQLATAAAQAAAAKFSADRCAKMGASAGGSATTGDASARMPTPTPALPGKRRASSKPRRRWAEEASP